MFTSGTETWIVTGDVLQIHEHGIVVSAVDVFVLSPGPRIIKQIGVDGRRGSDISSL